MKYLPDKHQPLIRHVPSKLEKNQTPTLKATPQIDFLL